MEKQGALALLLGAPKGEKDGAGSDLEDAARDMLDATKDDDAKAYALAFKRACRACEDDYEDEDKAPESEG